MKIRSRTIAPATVKDPLNEKTKSAVTAATSSMDFGANSLRFIAMGVKMTLSASIIAVLQTTEPIPFPIAIPTLSCDAAI